MFADRRVSRLCFGAIVAMLAGAIGAAEPPTLHQVVDGAIAAREKIKSYRLWVSAEVTDPGLPQQLSNGQTFVPTRVQVAYDQEVVVDLVGNRKYVAYRPIWEERADKRRVEDPWSVSGSTPEWELVGDGPVWQLRPPLPLGKSPRFSNERFDPLALGYGFQGNFGRGDSTSTVIGNLRTWEDKRGRWIDQGVVRFAKATDHELDVDTLRDYWPVRLNFFNGRSRSTYIVELSLERVGDLWLPTRGVIHDREVVSRLKFHWDLVNEPVDVWFTKERIERQFTVSLLDRR